MARRTLSFWLSYPTPLLRGGGRASQVPDTSLNACHALGPRQSLRNLTVAQCSGQALQGVCDSFVLASVFVKTIANCFDFCNVAELLWGGMAPLRPALFSVYASQLLFASCSCYQFDSFSCATLDTGGWLGFARQGLPPCKKRQAALGARTKKSPVAKRSGVLIWFGLFSHTICYTR